MSKQPLAPPSGSRDFLPREALFRDGVLSRVKAAFALHGFSPIDTPAFERIETLSGKYGEEGEKLIFKILKRGDKAASGEADLALRYDLTVPTMRMYAHRRGDLPRIVKRYQIGPVWRADRPGRGRFREKRWTRSAVAASSKGASRPCTSSAVSVTGGRALR